MQYQRSTLVGFPIRTPSGHSLFSNYPRLYAANHILHRLSAPGHPPYALSSLTPYSNWRISSQKTGQQLYAIVKDHHAGGKADANTYDR